MAALPVKRLNLENGRQVAEAAESQRQTELAIRQYEQVAEAEVICEEIDASAVADVVRHALTEEMAVLDEAMVKAGDSPAKRELVARMMAVHSGLDSGRIERKFRP